MAGAFWRLRQFVEQLEAAMCQRGGFGMSEHPRRLLGRQQVMFDGRDIVARG